MEKVEQENVANLEVAKTSSGNICVTQESINDDATAIIIEPKAVPALVELLFGYSVENPLTVDTRLREAEYAIYKLTVKQRNAAWEESNELRQTAMQLQAALDELYGKQFSSRAYHALLSRAEDAEQKSKLATDLLKRWIDDSTQLKPGYETREFLKMP